MTPKQPLTSLPSGPSGAARAVATLLAFVIPFDPLPLVFGRTLAFPIVLLLAYVVVIDLLLGRRSASLHPQFVVALMAYLFWLASSNYWSADPDASLTSTVQMLLRGILVLSLAYLIPESWRAMAEALLWGSVVLGLWLTLAGEEQYLGRTTLMGADENALALSLAVGFAISMFRASEASFRAAAVYLGLAGFLAMATLSTGSRTGLVAIAAVVLARVTSGQSRQRLARTLAVLTGIGIVGFILWQTGRVPDRVATFVQGGEVTDSRRSIMELFFAHPSWLLFGTGLHADATYLESNTGQYSYVHNLYLGTWVQLGVIGLAILAWMLAIVLSQARRSNRWELWSVAAGPVFAYTMTLPGHTSNVYWFVTALGVAGVSRARRDAGGSARSRGDGLKSPTDRRSIAHGVRYRT